MSVGERVSCPQNVCNVSAWRGILSQKCAQCHHTTGVSCPKNVCNVNARGGPKPLHLIPKLLDWLRWKLWNVLSCPKSVLFNNNKTSRRRDERQEMSKSVGRQQKPHTGGGKRYKRRWMCEVSCLVPDRELDRVWNILGLWEGFTSHPSTCLIKIHGDTQKVQNVFKSVTRPHDPPKKMPDLRDIYTKGVKCVECARRCVACLKTSSPNSQRPFPQKCPTKEVCEKMCSVFENLFSKFTKTLSPKTPDQGSVREDV